MRLTFECDDVVHDDLTRVHIAPGRDGLGLSLRATRPDWEDFPDVDILLSEVQEQELRAFLQEMPERRRRDRLFHALATAGSAFASAMGSG